MTAQLEVLDYSGRFKLFAEIDKAIFWVQK